MVSVQRSSNLAGNSTRFAALPARSLPMGANGRQVSAAPAPDTECLGMRVARVLAAEQRVISPGHEIYAEGEQAGDIFVVLDGWAVLYQILEDGRRQILDFALPGAILGLGGSAEAEMKHTAESLTELRVAVIPRLRLGELFTREPKLAMRFVETIAGVLESAYESLTDAGRRTAREAVAHLLLRLAQRSTATRPSAPGAQLELPLTLEHIGDALGLTAVHVCRTLRGLREDGVVTYCKGRLRIQSGSRLAAAAGAVSEDIPALSQRAAQLSRGLDRDRAASGLALQHTNLRRPYPDNGVGRQFV